MEAQVPLSTDILVIGGGPAGSYTAAVLAREGFDVILLEKDVFPRYHIGESMLPSCRPFLRSIDFEEKMKNYGFFPKPGAAFKLNQDKREGYIDFTANGPDNVVWNVVRSEFDDLLLRHAVALGVHVFCHMKDDALVFQSWCIPTRPVSLAWSKVDEMQGSVSFNWLVDASGRNGLMSMRYLKNRSFNKSLKKRYVPGTKRENAPWFEALTDETGWAWFIPLHNGATSHKKAQHRSESNGKSLSEMQHDRYLADLRRAPGLIQLLGPDAKFEGKLMSTSMGDYSYHVSEYTGSHFRIAGDAGVKSNTPFFSFYRPFFSSGIHLALTGGLSVASTIATSIRENCTEEEACSFHNSKVETCLYMIWAQETAVLYEAKEDNFDRAINSLRPGNSSISTI
ncbi:hypothetical protein EV421DRAFT_1893324 [Armillaria borealis]|uniref:FAD/NAD(P)-binding domain-containing protein n=1 Tax=Armillaria borealis TaxID=47425 RepID=A0AA39IW57_9AGAR|nr:hypothetical protein EV421DRAFT_1893324 [Armillaria borealis]